MVQNNLTKFTSDLIESSLPLDSERMFQANQVLEFSDFPNSRDEGWKYSRLNKVKNLKLQNQIDAEQNSALVNRNKIIIKDGLVLPFENTLGIVVETSAYRDQKTILVKIWFQSLGSAYWLYSHEVFHVKYQSFDIK